MPEPDDHKPEEPAKKKYPFWPDSLQDRPAVQPGQPVAGGIRKAAVALGKLAAQIFIFLFLFSPLYLLLAFTWGNDQLELAWLEILRLIFVTISVFLAVKLFEDIDIVDLGLNINLGALHDLLTGLLIAFGLLLMQFFLFWGLGWIRINGVAWEHAPLFTLALNLILTLGIFALTGWSEELLSRGYHLRILSVGFNRTLGVLFSSAIFASLHFIFLGWEWGYFTSTFLFGVVMCYAFFRTGQLWLSIGLHAGWDFFGVVVFGLASTNGFDVFHLLDIRLTSRVNAGILFAAETLGMVVMAVMIHFYRRHKQPEPLDW